MAPTIAEAITPLKIPNKEELETDFAPTIEEYGIKEELIARYDPEESISQTEPMLRENDEESYEEEAAMTSHFSREGKQDTSMEPTIVEASTVSKVSSEGNMETTFAHTTKEATTNPKFISKEEQGTMTTPKYYSREESKVSTSTRKEGSP